MMGEAILGSQGASEDVEKFALAISVGMGAAAEVARLGGYPRAADHIREYEKTWSSRVMPRSVRKMVRGDIMPPSAARYATFGDLGLDSERQT